MAKWADHVISKVKYNDAKTHIVMVKAHSDNGDTIGTAEDWDRKRVVSALDSGKTFVTILAGDDGKWKKGQEVHTIKVGGVMYIRTDQNQKASDNLENLPEF